MGSSGVETMTIQDIKIGQQFHAKCHSRFNAPRILILVGVSDTGAFLVRWKGQVVIFINPNAPIVLIQETHHD